MERSRSRGEPPVREWRGGLAGDRVSRGDPDCTDDPGERGATETEAGTVFLDRASLSVSG